ncbi:ABC transporter substrate-binding protein [Virgibacillus soli]|uniref:ABC transporter substrate-binding protein n=1 Tax=Paracerasibacillus soli TaxID=480284 RepID=A0ABU5CWI6_9BACI|nr:ABC transporter substrate-binding protein [Virgibacillus soli]MDY0410217.1 ABC transporter substrate-binding protein [Virgibacillus soli]
MRKGFIIISTFLIVISLTLVGCSKDKSSGDADKTVVNLFNMKVETKEQMDDLVAKYEKENPNVKVIVTTVGAGQDGATALQAKFASGEEPSIFLLGGLPETQKYLDKLADVSDTKAAKAAIEGTLEGATIDGVPYGLPMNIEGFGWMINKDIFAKAGIDVASIKTYEDFTKAVETLESKKGELGLDAVFAFSAKEDWVVNQFSNHFSAPEYHQSIISAFESKEINYEFGDRMKEYTDLINKHNIQPILSVDYSTSVEELFANEKVAIVHQGNWIVPTLDSLDPEFSKTKLGILPFFVESDTEGKISAGPSWYWGINNTLEENVVKEAKKFLDWMYTSDEGKKALTEEFQFIPAYEGYDVDSFNDPVSKEVYNALLDGKTSVWAMNQYPNGWYSSSLFPEFQKYLNGDISWDEFTANTSKKYTEMR